MPRLDAIGTRAAKGASLVRRGGGLFLVCGVLRGVVPYLDQNSVCGSNHWRPTDAIEWRVLWLFRGIWQNNGAFQFRIKR